MTHHDPRPTLVLIHGLLSSPSEFALIAQILQARGIRFDFLEIPGYTLADRKRPATHEAWVSEAGKVLDARYGPGEAIVLGGLCVGGSIAATLALQPRQQRLCGLAMLSPSFDYDGWGLAWWRRLRGIGYVLGVDRWISFAEREPFGIKNPRIRKWVVRAFETGEVSSVGPSRLPLWGLHETEKLQRRLRKRIAELSCPLLVLHAREDEITSLASVARWAGSLGRAARLVVLEESYHMITVDNARHRVAHTLADFIDASPTRSGAAPRPGIAPSHAADVARMTPSPRTPAPSLSS